MSSAVPAILVMLLSAAMYALSFVLQHKGTQQSIGMAHGEALDGPGGSAGVARLVRNPFWVAGVTLFGLSFLVHLVALSLGAVAVVQPLIVTELIFIPPFAALISHARISRRDVAAILVVCAALAGFMIVARPGEGDRVPSIADWVVLFAGCALAMGVLMAVGRRQSDSIRATMFGAAGGVVNALLALTAKGAFSGEHPDLGSWLGDWLVWATVLVALATVWTTALAFRAGPITSSTPAMISINPVVSTMVAVWLFGEMISHTPIDLILIAAAAAVIVAGVWVLSNSPAVHASEEHP